MSQLDFDRLSPAERKEYLLRVLGFDPLTISRIRNGEILLSEALSSRIDEVMNNPADTTQCAIICQNIKRDKVSYETLDATPYLEHINELKARGGRFADDEPGPVKADRYPDLETGRNIGSGVGAHAVTGTRFARPILRYIARFLDQMVGKLVVNLMFIFLFRISPVSLAISSYGAQTGSGQALLLSLYNILSIAVIYIVEPFMIHFFGTTCGKFIFGIRILNEDGSKLTLGQAFRRTVNVLVFGCGVHLPFIRIFTLVNSYNRCKRGEILRWDMGVQIDHPEDNSAKRTVAAVCFTLFVGILTTLCVSLGSVVPNRGNITQDQFYENCRHVVQYENITFNEIPDYIIDTDSSGYVKSVSFSITSEGEEKIYGYYDQMYVAFMALSGSPGDVIRSTLSGTGINSMLSNCFSDFTDEYSGLKITNTVETEGYALSPFGYLYQSTDTDTHTYRQTFTVRKY